MKYNNKTWNYEHPINLWESLPWQLRWSAAIGLIIYFGGALIAPFILMLR